MEPEIKLKKHAHRDDLTGECVWGDIGQTILLVIFLVVWVLDSFVLRYTTFLSVYVPFYIQLPLVVLLLISSGYFSQAGLRIVFGETRDHPMVIHKGVFNIVRHPIYFGAVLGYLGLTLASCSLAAFVLWLGITYFYNYISLYEEKLLLQYFGAEYRQYMNEVPMWIPKFRKRKS